MKKKSKSKGKPQQYCCGDPTCTLESVKAAKQFVPLHLPDGVVIHVGRHRSDHGAVVVPSIEAAWEGHVECLHCGQSFHADMDPEFALWAVGVLQDHAA